VPGDALDEATPTRARDRDEDRLSGVPQGNRGPGLSVRLALPGRHQPLPERAAGCVTGVKSHALRKLRGSRPTVLRAITPPNALPGAEDVAPPFVTPVISPYRARAEKQAICRAMTQYEGRCVDLLRAFNGASGTENAYEKGLMNHDNCCYPSAEGQQLIAELVVRTGLAPLE
jgi:hypothetical protein